LNTARGRRIEIDEHGSIGDDALHRDAAVGGGFPAAAVARATRPDPPALRNTKGQ